MPRRAAEGPACCRRWSGAGRQQWRRRQLHDHACGGVQRRGGERTRREAHEGRLATLNGTGSMGLVLCTTARTISACWRRRRRERCVLSTAADLKKRLGAFLVHGAADQQKLFTWVQDDWGSLSTRTSGTRVRTGVCGSLSGTQGRRYEKVFSAQLMSLQ